ncbi:MAG: PorV/PorQ family protein, partial [Gemmatimonadota bacterium]
LIPLGARNVGFGGAVAGAMGDVEGAVWNPAVLAGIGEWAVYYHGADDFGTSTHAVGGVASWGATKVGLSLLAVDLGAIEGRDAANNPIGTIDLANTLAILTLARSISSEIEVGASYKFVRLGGSCQGCTGLEPDATGHAFDVAVSTRPAVLERVRFGLILANLGGGMSLRSDGPSDPLPARVRLGAEVEVREPSAERDVELRARADVQQTFTEFDDFDLFAGAEVGYRSIAYVRAGYAITGSGRSGASLGIGVRHRGFGLDVGRRFDDFSDFESGFPFQLSVSYEP